MNRLDELVRATLDDRANDAPPPSPVVDRVLAGRSRDRRRSWLVSGTVAAVTVAIVAVGVGIAHDRESPTSTDPFASSDSASTAEQRTIAVYSAALESFIRDSRQSFQHGIPDQILVAIRPEQDAGWASGSPETGDPLPADVRDAISAQLAHVTSLMWVDKLPIPAPNDPPGQAQATITLGLLPEGDEKIEVSLSGFHGFNNGWLTSYVLEHSGGHWTVSGPGQQVGIT